MPKQANVANTENNARRRLKIALKTPARCWRRHLSAGVCPKQIQALFRRTYSTHNGTPHSHSLLVKVRAPRLRRTREISPQQKYETHTNTHGLASRQCVKRQVDMAGRANAQKGTWRQEHTAHERARRGVARGAADKIRKIAGRVMRSDSEAKKTSAACSRKAVETLVSTLSLVRHSGGARTATYRSVQFTVNRGEIALAPCPR